MSRFLSAMLLLALPAIPVSAESYPLIKQVERASTQFDQATSQLDQWQRYQDQAARSLANCKTSACEKKESAHLESKKKKVAQSEEAVADAAQKYLVAETAYKREYGEFRNQTRVSDIQRAMAIAEGAGEEGGDGGQGSQPSGDKLSDYKLVSPEVGGGREIDPRRHMSYDKGTRDPGVVVLDDDKRMVEYAAAAAEAGEGDEVELPFENRGGTVGGPSASRGVAVPSEGVGGSGRGRTVADRGGIRQSHGAAGLPRVAVSEDSGRGASEKNPFSVRPDDRPGAMRGESRGFVRAGRQKVNAGDYFTAYDQSRQAVAADAADPSAWLLKAKAASGLGTKAAGAERVKHFEDAERAALEAIRLDSNNGEAYRELAFAQLHLGKTGEAIDSATRAIRRDGSDARAYALRAFAYEQMGRRKEMIRDLQKAATLDPGRFDRVLRDALAGIRVFDPSMRDSRRLLDAMTAIPPDSVGDHPPLVLIGLLLIGCALSGLAAALVWRKLRAEEAPFQESGGITIAAPESEGAAAASGKSKRLAGKYELKRTIGRGAWGQVWEALDCSLGRLAAVKQIDSVPGDADGPAPTFHLKEARILASMQHPNIVDIYEVLELPEGVFLVFEMLQGKTVQQILAERKRLPPGEVRSILGAAASALSTAHASRIVHRDIKPANLMVTEEGQVKIMDFGIAHFIGDAEDARGIVPRPGEPLRTDETSHLVGTPGYRPPEADRGIVSVAFDLYSLGVCAFEMLVGRRPFSVPDETTPRQAAAVLGASVPGLSPEAAAIFMRLVEPDYTRRASSVEEFMKFLSLLESNRGAKTFS